MNFVEQVDKQKLKLILDNETNLYNVIEYDTPEELKQKLCILKTYYKKLDKNGRINVEYKQIDDYGRFNAVKSQSLQNIMKQIRGTIAEDLYYDIDMVNAHPTIICNMFDTPFLEEYVEDRDDIIRDIIDLNENLKFNQVKTIILKILYGGKCNIIKTKWLKSYIKEMKLLLKDIKTKYPKIYKKVKKQNKDDYNLDGKTLAKVIQNVENDYLQIMIDYFKKHKIITKNAVMCFDGIMIQKKRVEEDDLPKHLKTIEEKFENQGIPLKLKLKPFETLNLEALCNSVSDDEDSDIEEELPLMDYNSDNGYYWIDFCNELNEKGKDTGFTKEDLIQYVKRNLNRVMIFVIETKSCIIKLSKDEMFNWDKHLPDNWFIYWIPGEGDLPPEEKSINLRMLFKIKGIDNFLKSYNRIAFKPNQKVCDRDFNTWTGFKAEKIDEVDMKIIEPILHHIKEVISAGDDDTYKYIMSWIKHILTKPEIKSKVAVILYSKEQQVGKGLFLNFIMDYVIGRKYSLYMNGLDKLTSRFNGHLMNKLFINVDELSSLDKNSYHGVFDTLKSRITEPNILIEKKGIEGFEFNDYMNIICCTNNNFTLRVEEDDNRIFITQCSPKYKGDRKYFDNLNKTLNQNTANHFYSYMCEFDGVDDIKDIPMTLLKREMIINCLSPPKRFLYRVKELQDEKTDDEYDEYNWKTIIKNEKLLSGSELYAYFKNWLNEENEKPMSNQRFGREIKDMIEKKRSNGAKYDLSTINLK